MEFELSSFLIGLISGLVIAFLLKLKALKSLSLDLKKLGISLGVEGFEAENQPDAQGGIKIEGGISGQTGDLAGGNIDKSTRYSSKMTLNQMIDELSSKINIIRDGLPKLYEQKSLLYDVKTTKDIESIHREIQNELFSGWFIASSTILPFDDKEDDINPPKVVDRDKMAESSYIESPSAKKQEAMYEKKLSSYNMWIVLSRPTPSGNIPSIKFGRD